MIIRLPLIWCRRFGCSYFSHQVSLQSLTMTDSPCKKRMKGLNEADKKAFDNLFPVLVEDLTKRGMKDDQIADAMKYFKKVNEYNVPHGKRNRGLTVATSYRYLMGDKATEEELLNARVIGWCVEWLQAYFLVADDVMDHSITRRGQPCWYRNEGVGLQAINDSFYLESAIYVLLKKYLRAKPYYVNIVELFHEININTVIGQCLDMAYSEQSGHVDFTNYTLDKYTAIATWKTAYYSFYLPIAAAMYMAGIEDEASHENAKTILLKMGVYFQIQDDYLDCFGDPEVTGKVGTDIEDNKCSWIVVQALHRATPEQRQLIQDNYAQNDPAKVAVVKKVFEEIGMRKVFAEFEERSYNELQELITKLSGNLPAEMFVDFANKIYKRNK